MLCFLYFSSSFPFHVSCVIPFSLHQLKIPFSLYEWHVSHFRAQNYLQLIHIQQDTAFKLFSCKSHQATQCRPIGISGTYSVSSGAGNLQKDSKGIVIQIVVTITPLFIQVIRKGTTFNAGIRMVIYVNEMTTGLARGFQLKQKNTSSGQVSSNYTKALLKGSHSFKIKLLLICPGR